jgi:NAD(P)H-dependent FMN reductase
MGSHDLALVREPTLERLGGKQRKPTLLIVIASVRQGRRGGAVGNWIYDLAVANGAFDVSLIDLRKLDLPLSDEPHHPKQGHYLHQHTRDWSSQVAAADAFVFVTPEYNHGLAAPLKNAIDYLHAEWQCKPVSFVSYGGAAGGTRAVQMLKQVVLSLRMLPAYQGVAISAIADRVHEDADRFEADQALAGAAERMLTELGCLEVASRPLRHGTN